MGARPARTRSEGPLRFRCGARRARRCRRDASSSSSRRHPADCCRSSKATRCCSSSASTSSTSAKATCADQSTADAGAFADAAGLRAESGPASDPLFWVLLVDRRRGASLANWCLLLAAAGHAVHEPRARCSFPELLLLLVPLLVLYFWRGRSSGARRRRPRRDAGAAGAASRRCRWRRSAARASTSSIVADLSRSMPADSRAPRARDRQAARAAARRRAIASASSRSAARRASNGCRRSSARRARSCRRWMRDGSDLGGAIALAASLIPRGRPGRSIVLSDGEANGTPVTAAAHEAAARGLPIDFRAVQPRRRGRHRRRVARSAGRRRRARAVSVHRLGAHRSHRRDRGGAVA